MARPQGRFADVFGVAQRSFFGVAQRSFSLYNRPIVRRFQLRSGAASDVPTVGRSKSRMFLLVRQFRESLRWRRRLGSSPQLSRCWRAVRRSPRFERGYIAIEGQVCPLADLRFPPTAHAELAPQLEEDVKAGIRQIAVFTLSYLVKGKPQDRILTNFFVSIRTHKLLGNTSGYLSGF